MMQSVPPISLILELDFDFGPSVYERARELHCLSLSKLVLLVNSEFTFNLRRQCYIGWDLHGCLRPSDVRLLVNATTKVDLPN